MMTIAEWIDRVARQLERQQLHFGHGTDNARDEAAWLVLHVVGAPLDGKFDQWGEQVDNEAAARIQELAELRCQGRRPLAYLLGKAWFAGLEFEVTPDVLVPRSPIAELILDAFAPWARPDRITGILDLCTGSGCIAIACAHYLAGVQVDAVDISARALDVAGRNVRRHGVSDRVALMQSDLFQSVAERRYDLIIANPPYVPAAAMKELPAEYRTEPELGLASGADGLDATLSILVDASAFLGEDGVLICEVGESAQALSAALPRVPFVWLEFEHGGSGVFVLTRAQLEAAGPDLAELIGDRKNVV
jgi:ribosomal protein L3 glutamine methyltransferase